MYSAPDLVSLMQSWVESDKGSVMIQSSRLHLDPTCYTKLDSLFANDCISPVTSTTLPYKPTTAASVKPPTPAPVNGSVSAGEIGGIAVGVVIVLLLIILIVVIILKKWRPKVIRR